MQIFSLPEALELSMDDPIQLFDYRTWQSISRSKVNLTKNTFSFLREGTKEVLGDHEVRTIENDSFLLLKAGNCLMTETVSKDQKAYHSVLLFFRDEDLLEFLEKNETDLPPPTEADSFQVCEYDAYIKHFVQGLEGLMKLEKAQSSKLLKIKFEEIMTYLLQREGEAFLNTILHEQDNPMIRFKRVVENNKHTKLTLVELAFLSNMSLSTFKREFAKYYQSSPSKWFQEKRLEHAAYLLSHKQKRATELYEDAGYDSLSNFIQAFKRKYGATPKQYQVRA